MKTCNKCGETKEETEFYTGRKECKTCKNKYKKQYEKEFKLRPEQILKREELEKIHQQKLIEYESKIKYKYKNKFIEIKYNLEDICKQNTRQLILDKKILKQKDCNCIICNKSGTEVPIHYHHKDYRDINNIVPLCQKCHINIHKIVKTIYPKELFEGIDIPKKFLNKVELK